MAKSETKSLGLRNRGRPKGLAHPIRITVYVSEEMGERIMERRTDENFNLSHIVRAALDAYLPQLARKGREHVG